MFTEKHVLTHYVSYSSKICVSTFSKTNVSDSGPWPLSEGFRGGGQLDQVMGKGAQGGQKTPMKMSYRLPNRWTELLENWHVDY